MSSITERYRDLLDGAGDAPSVGSSDPRAASASSRLISCPAS